MNQKGQQPAVFCLSTEGTCRVHAAYVPLRKALLSPPHQLTYHVPCQAWGSGHRNCHFSQKRSRASAERYGPALLAFPTISSHTMLRKEYICGRVKVNQVQSKYRMAAFLNRLKRCTIRRGLAGQGLSQPLHVTFILGCWAEKGPAEKRALSWCWGQIFGPFLLPLLLKFWVLMV